MIRTETTVGGSQVVNSYAYDGAGRRVKKVASGSATIFVYDAQGHMAAEYAGAGTVSTTTVKYLTADHLGSTRVVTDPLKEVVTRRDYLPFGEELTKTLRLGTKGYGNDNDRVAQKFTGKERDGESALDYFGARYFSGPQARFTSSDEPLVDQYEFDPQSWNLYSYVRNNPLRFVDADGRECKNGVDEKGDPCIPPIRITVTERNLVPVLRFILESQLRWHAQLLQSAADTTLRFLSTRDFGCAAAVGVGVGSAGAVAGLAGGPGGFVTVPTGLVGGLGVGLGAGLISCSKATGSGGGGGGGPTNSEATAERIARDATGKVHGELPRFVPKTWTPAQLREAAHELRESIKARLLEQLRLGENGPHRFRINEELRLLRQIEKTLSGS